MIDVNVCRHTSEAGEQRMRAENAVADLLEFVGEDPRRDGLRETPRRVVRAWQELTSGYSVDPGSLLKTFENDGTRDMVVVRDVQFYSLCEHHALPFFGVAHIAYVPGDRIVGLSKFARLVDAFARRLQVQERLTHQIAETLDAVLQPDGVMVVVEAEHFCMAMRGVQKPGSRTVTSAVRGVFNDQPETRAEAMGLLTKGATR
jgi:GTP cyclohydrolase I